MMRIAPFIDSFVYSSISDRQLSSSSITIYYLELCLSEHSCCLISRGRHYKLFDYVEHAALQCKVTK